MPKNMRPIFETDRAISSSAAGVASRSSSRANTVGVAEKAELTEVEQHHGEDKQQERTTESDLDTGLVIEADDNQQNALENESAAQETELVGGGCRASTSIMVTQVDWSTLSLSVRAHCCQLCRQKSPCSILPEFLHWYGFMTSFNIK